MNVPSVWIVTLPPPEVANVPAEAETPPAGKSFAVSDPLSVTNGVPGDAVAPPVTTACVLSTRLVYESLLTTGAIDNVYVAPVPLQPFVSVDLTVIGNVPVCVGVPERTPVAESVMPAGNV